MNVEIKKNYGNFFEMDNRLLKGEFNSRKEKSKHKTTTKSYV